MLIYAKCENYNFELELSSLLVQHYINPSTTLPQTSRIRVSVPTTLNLVSISGIAGAEEPPMLINFGVSGSWYEPTTSGQGFVFDVAPSNNLIAAYWFTFPVEGGEREWYLKQAQ